MNLGKPTCPRRLLQRLVQSPSSILLAHCARNLGAVRVGPLRLSYLRRAAKKPVMFLVLRAFRSARWFDWDGERFRPTRW